jgi:uncharacterized protein YndB with AHSA1/START domain
MGKAFDLTYEREIDASPEEVWEAISTGPGLDAWFMGRNQVEPRAGGRWTSDIAGYPMESTVTTWEPPSRLVSEAPPAPDGSRHTFDYELEPRGAGTTVRWRHTGFLGSEHWEAEYEGMSEGDPVYFDKLVEYLTYFRGRTAVPVNVFQPGPADKEAAWAAYRSALGLDHDVADGEPVTISPSGFEPVAGIVDVRTPSFLGVRTDDAMYRFMHVDWNQSVGVGHHIFDPGLDPAEAEAAWRAWLAGVFPA